MKESVQFVARIVDSWFDQELIMNLWLLLRKKLLIVPSEYERKEEIDCNPDCLKKEKMKMFT